MKFKSLVMDNFMRYKGKNTITFSCDPEKNVTVVLGDNTVGKTTIAQAFRWCLYGAVFAERGKKQGDYELLNHDILAMMDANSRASVCVEIVAEDANRRYQIRRQVEYTRAFPKMMEKEFHKKIELRIYEAQTADAGIEVEKGKIEEVINELFPKSLSHYFLFDGERWNDVTVDGVRENIKDSVHILTGLSAYRAAIRHLKEMGGNSVIRKFKDKIQGGGNIYDNLQADRNKMEREIEKCEEEINTIDINIANYAKKCREIEEYLEQNKNTQLLQARRRQLMTVRVFQNDKKLTNYKALVNEFSDKAYMLLALPLIEAAGDMVRAVEGERRDIPHMHQDSIDYIIRTGKCICSTAIIPDSKEFKALMEQRNYLPPADIGSLLGEFEKTANRWSNRCSDLKKELEQNAEKVDDNIRDYEETCNQLSALEHTMDENIDFGEKKRLFRNYQEEQHNLSLKKGEMQGRIVSLKKRIASIETDMHLQEAKSEENAKWRIRVDMAERLYNRLKNDFEEKEKQIFLELNQQIQENFIQMFNAKDKKISLTEQYEIQMLYRTQNGFREEKNLSEGEKIARNFAFIVTIMEYSRKNKERKLTEQMQEDAADTLPIVLDGPFSKLGDENIRLIAGVLPKVSEQIILFMLKKDWEYTGLGSYVGASYEIEKKAQETYASIHKMGDIEHVGV